MAVVSTRSAGHQKGGKSPKVRHYRVVVAGGRKLRLFVEENSTEQDVWTALWAQLGWGREGRTMEDYEILSGGHVVTFDARLPENSVLALSERHATMGDLEDPSAEDPSGSGQWASECFRLNLAMRELLEEHEKVWRELRAWRQEGAAAKGRGKGKANASEAKGKERNSTDERARPDYNDHSDKKGKSKSDKSSSTNSNNNNNRSSTGHEEQKQNRRGNPHQQAQESPPQPQPQSQKLEEQEKKEEKEKEKEKEKSDKKKDTGHHPTKAQEKKPDQGPKPRPSADQDHSYGGEHWEEVFQEPFDADQFERWLDQTRWLEGSVSGVAPFGIFVDACGVTLLVKVEHLPPEHTQPGTKNPAVRVPSLSKGAEVAIRVLGHRGLDSKGHRKFVATMLPLTEQ